MVEASSVLRLADHLDYNLSAGLNLKKNLASLFFSQNNLE